VEEHLRDIALQDGRYAPDAYRFLFESLEHAIRLAGKEQQSGADRHVSGRELLAGIRSHAMSSFGPLTPSVWKLWGVGEPLDWGRMVFVLVENKLLNRQESDTLDDFREELDLEEVFVKRWRPGVRGEHDPAGDAPARGEGRERYPGSDAPGAPGASGGPGA
jgi:uncharacterized repeat protein (TIGR04138 family)